MPGRYRKMGLEKNDMIIHEDHRGRFRVDMITTGSGNSITLGPTTGYGSAEEAAAEAKREFHRRGFRKGLIYKQGPDGSYGLYRERGPSGLSSRLRDLEPNGRTTVSDPTAARELSLYIENEYSLIGAPNSIGKSIDANLRRKLASGKYDSALAPKAWEHLIDAGAKKYEKEFGDGSSVFNAATRRSVAVDFARAWEDENLRMDPHLARECQSVAKMIGSKSVEALAQGRHVRVDPTYANKIRQLVLVAGEAKVVQCARESGW